MYKVILGAAIFSMATLASAASVDVTVTTTNPVADTESITITASKSDVASLKSANCITETGTRIKNRPKDKNGCNGLAGRSYDRDDIDRTGALTVGEALSRLDPSIRGSF